MADPKKKTKALHVVIGPQDDNCPLCMAAREGPEAFIRAVAKEDPEAARILKKNGVHQGGKPVVIDWPAPPERN